MTFPTKIYLPNRYGDKNYLELRYDFESNVNNVTVGKYKLVVENDIPYRCGIDKGKFFIDPSGGPLIKQGYAVGNLEIIDVTKMKENVYVDVVYNSEVM